jgi:twitching motility protein PilT
MIEEPGSRQPIPQQLPLPDAPSTPSSLVSAVPVSGSIELPPPGPLLTTPVASAVNTGPSQELSRRAEAALTITDLSPAPPITPAPTVVPSIPPVPSESVSVPSTLISTLESRLKQLETQLALQGKEIQQFRPGAATLNGGVVALGHCPVDLDIARPLELNFSLDDLLRVVINYNASDLHVKAGAPPTVRLNGDLVPIGNRVLTESESLYLVMQSIPPEKRQQLQRIREIDHAYVSRGVRFRLNAFLERGRVSAAYRMISNTIPTFESLGLPPVLARLANLHNGLVLVTGPAGSGKSTTLASVVDWINRNRRSHVVTIEDPIEYYHHDVHSFITQREVGTDTTSFAEALRQALRQDPNVIMVGEMRDTETILTAVTAAETGHLVLSTLHTPNTVQSIDRILDTFAGEQQKQIRMLLSSCLRGVVAQKLLQRSDGKGRVCAVEVLVCTSTIQSLIMEGNTKEIYPYIQQGGSEGMQTFTASLTRLLEQGLVTREEAMFHADQTTEFRLANRHTEGNSANVVPGGNYLNWL